MKLKVGRFYKRRDGALVFVWRVNYSTDERPPEYSVNYVLLCGRNHIDLNFTEWFCCENGRHFLSQDIPRRKEDRPDFILKDEKSTHDLITEVKNPQYYWAEDHNIYEINDWLDNVQNPDEHIQPINPVEIAAVCGALRKVGLDMFIEKCEEGGDEDERIRVVRRVPADSEVQESGS